MGQRSLEEEILPAKWDRGKIEIQGDRVLPAKLSGVTVRGDGYNDVGCDARDRGKFAEEKFYKMGQRKIGSLNKIYYNIKNFYLILPKRNSF